MWRDRFGLSSCPLRFERLSAEQQARRLEVAPYLIVVFRIDYGLLPRPDGTTEQMKHYYVAESVGIVSRRRGGGPTHPQEPLDEIRIRVGSGPAQSGEA